MATAWHISIDALRADGFAGFVSVRELRDRKLACVPGKRGDMGVYVVLRLVDGAPEFLKTSSGGRHKGRDPNVANHVLRAKWILNTRIIYIGKAGAPGSPVTLRSRLKEYLDFGAGRPIGHWGGRYTWHLPDSEKLVICWRLTPAAVPREVEKQMIREFVGVFGARPFANLKD